MRCAEAAIAIRRGPRRAASNAYKVGARFTIGRYACTTYYSNYELYKSRCVRGARAFRFDWGY